ncbi:hypothetical protein SFMTTN_2821 [Sulfuriferula multivorans]|uniref:Uncharacterized protein n=1 Tax=Sulfuriferula multivorans TaxID=1559896 RepID=A0A401K033_9PROT|nr:hypothetical protein [Sulfuriferula multivorans]GCB02005.1 hypothetical protein SFMTTN_2821 [Sulfuriferula multivorans]
MQKTYVGIDQDQYGGMSAMGAIIKDAWLFGILPETETCAGWDVNRIQILYDKTQVEWDKYGCLASNLPAELRERHARIHAAAIERAKTMGWEPEMYLSE